MILTAAFAIILLAVLTFVLGSLMPFRPVEFFAHLFIRMLSGTTILVTSISIFTTAGRTIFILMPAVFVTAFLLHLPARKASLHRLQSSRAGLITAALCFVATFIWFFSVAYDLSGFPYTHIERDNVFYGEVSRALIMTGNENTHAMSNFAAECFEADNIRLPWHDATPYHYFELWINGAIARLTGINYTLALYLITWPFMSALLLIGLLGVIAQFKKPGLYDAGFAFLLLFIGGFYKITRIAGITENDGLVENSLAHFGSKLLPVYLFCLGALLCNMHNDGKKFTLLLLLCIPLINAALAPAVITTIVVISTWQLLKGNDRRTHAALLLLCFIIATFFLTFYRPDQASLNHRLHRPLAEFSDLSNGGSMNFRFFVIELLLKIFPAPVFILANYAPYVLITWLAVRQDKTNWLKQPVFVACLAVLCGLISAKALYKMDNGHQLFNNTLVFGHVLFTMSAIRLMYGSSFRYRKPLMTLFIMMQSGSCLVTWFSHERSRNSHYSHSDNFITEVNKMCDTLTGPAKGVALYRDGFFENKNISYPLELYDMPFVVNQSVIWPLSAIPPEARRKAVTRHMHQLYKSAHTLYLEKHPAEKNGLYAFVAAMKARYVIAGDTTRVRGLNYSARAIDENTGQVFLLLKQ